MCLKNANLFCFYKNFVKTEPTELILVQSTWRTFGMNGCDHQSRKNVTVFTLWTDNSNLNFFQHFLHLWLNEICGYLKLDISINLFSRQEVHRLCQQSTFLVQLVRKQSTPVNKTQMQVIATPLSAGETVVELPAVKHDSYHIPVPKWEGAFRWFRALPGISDFRSR